MQLVLIYRNLLKTDLASSKQDADELDIDKFKKCMKGFKQFEK